MSLDLISRNIRSSDISHKFKVVTFEFNVAKYMPLKANYVGSVSESNTSTRIEGLLQGRKL